jgi:pimeloyl-ACP methyl ester carboxylesterase
VRTRLVVAADGRHSSVGEMAGVSARQKPNNRSGYFAYFKGVSVDRTKLWFLEPDIAYAFPCDQELTILATMFPKQKLAWFSGDMPGNLFRLIKSVPDGPDLTDAEQVSKVLGLVDLPNTWRRRPPPGLAFIGDAAVGSDPLFGVGCGWAFQSGEWLAEEVGGNLDNSRSTDQAVARYRRRLRSKIASHNFMICDYSSARPYNPAERIIFSAATSDKKTARKVAAFAARTAPVRELVSPVTLTRAALVNAKNRAARKQTTANRALPAEVSLSTEYIIDVDGIRSPVLEAGPADSTEAVVFVHGNPGSSEDWRPLVGEAGQFARAIAIDLPGFGRADKPADFDHTVEGYATHLGKALERLGVDRAHLVLHDFGGLWGLAWAARDPDAFASAVLINTGILHGYRWHYLARIWQTPGVGEAFMAAATRPGFRLLLKHGNARGLPTDFIDRMYRDFDKGTKRAILRLYRASRDPRPLLDQLSASLRGLDRPVLVVWGARDPYVPVKHAHRQRDTFPEADVLILNESGHWPFVDDPVAMRWAVVPFLRKVAGSLTTAH